MPRLSLAYGLHADPDLARQRVLPDVLEELREIRVAARAPLDAADDAWAVLAKKRFERTGAKDRHRRARNIPIEHAENEFECLARRVIAKIPDFLDDPGEILARRSGLG